MAAKGSVVKVFTGDGEKWVPGVVSSGADDDGKHVVTVFPGYEKDSENLQENASVLLSAPGTGKYEHEAL